VLVYYHSSFLRPNLCINLFPLANLFGVNQFHTLSTPRVPCTLAILELTPHQSPLKSIISLAHHDLFSASDTRHSPPLCLCLNLLNCFASSSSLVRAFFFSIPTQSIRSFQIRFSSSPLLCSILGVTLEILSIVPRPPARLKNRTPGRQSYGRRFGPFAPISPDSHGKKGDKSTIHANLVYNSSRALTSDIRTENEVLSFPELRSKAVIGANWPFRTTNLPRQGFGQRRVQAESRHLREVGEL
jgi:hypothetical protein